MTAEQQRLWDAGPSPSWTAIAAAAGVELAPTSPEEPGRNAEWLTQAFWPVLHRTPRI